MRFCHWTDCISLCNETLTDIRYQRCTCAATFSLLDAAVLWVYARASRVTHFSRDAVLDTLVWSLGQEDAAAAWRRKTGSGKRLRNNKTQNCIAHCTLTCLSKNAYVHLHCTCSSQEEKVSLVIGFSFFLSWTVKIKHKILKILSCQQIVFFIMLKKY